MIGDSFHFMDRFEVRVHHGSKKSYFIALRRAWFMFDRKAYDTLVLAHRQTPALRRTKPRGAAVPGVVQHGRPRRHVREIWNSPHSHFCARRGAQDDHIEPEVKAKYTSEQRYLCESMGTPAPLLPIHGEAEHRLFDGIVRTAGSLNFDQMALNLFQKVNGVMIFPKPPVYLRTHYAAWQRSRRVNEAMRTAAAGAEVLALLNETTRRELLASAAASTPPRSSGTGPGFGPGGSCGQHRHRNHQWHHRHQRQRQRHQQRRHQRWTGRSAHSLPRQPLLAARATSALARGCQARAEGRCARRGRNQYGRPAARAGGQVCEAARATRPRQGSKKGPPVRTVPAGDGTRGDVVPRAVSTWDVPTAPGRCRGCPPPP